jgi:ribonuclease HI
MKNIQPHLFDKGYTVMHCDGASSGNPGRAGVGVVIALPEIEAQQSGKKAMYRLSEYIGIATNNVAEYSALIKGLEKARSLGVSRIKIFLDSELLVRQMNGIYRVKNKNLVPLWNHAKDILKAFESCEIRHVRREMNKEADALAREAVKKGGMK